VSATALIGASALLAVVVAIVTAPLRRPGVPATPLEDERSELEARREAKYREIRDAELDYRTGKLSRADHDAIDGALRAEALEILDRLESTERRDGGGGSGAPGAMPKDASGG
jgi:hypothetical protein